jgi:hypothetical protein
VSLNLALKQHLEPDSEVIVKGVGVCRSGFITLPPEPLQEQPVVILLWGRVLPLGC